MFDAKLESLGFFRHVLHAATPADRRWEKTLAALLLVAAAAPVLSLSAALAAPTPPARLTSASAPTHLPVGDACACR